MHAMTSAAGQAIGMQFKISTRLLFRACLTTAIAVGQTYSAARLATYSIQDTAPFAVTAGLLAERIAEPIPLLGIYLRPRRVAAIHDHRPVLVKREKEVLAEHPSLRVVPRGGEPGDLGEVTLAWRVVTGQIVGEFIDPLRDHLAEHGEERARISDLLADIWEAALPLPAYEFAVVGQRAAAGRIRSRQVWVPGHRDRPPRTAGVAGLRTAGVASTRSTGTLGPGTVGAGRRISVESRQHSG